MPELRNQIDTGVRAPFRAPQPRRPFGAARAERRADRAGPSLRRQIARLERRLGELFASAFPRQGIEWRVGAVGGPRVLGDGRARAGPRRARRPPAARRRRELARRADAGGGQPRPARADDRRARALPLGPGLQRGHRRARAAGTGTRARAGASSGCSSAGGGSSSPPVVPLAEGLTAPDPRLSSKRKKRGSAGRRHRSARTVSAERRGSQPAEARAEPPRRPPAGALGRVSPGRARRPRRAGAAGARLLRRQGDQGALMIGVGVVLGSTRRPRALDPRALRRLSLAHPAARRASRRRWCWPRSSTSAPARCPRRRGC